MLAWTHVFEAMNGWSEDRVAALSQAALAADRAFELDSSLPVAHFVRGLVYRELGNYDKALVEAGQAIARDPNYANAHVLLATLLYYTGQPQQGLEMILKAMQLNPHHPYNYPFHLGQAYFILQRYPDACTEFEAGLQSNPSAERLHVWLAAAYAQAGRREDASWEAEQVLTLNPEFSLQRMQESFPFQDPADLARFLDGLRMAGFSG
jgi:adenylate cyclase